MGHVKIPVLASYAFLRSATADKLTEFLACEHFEVLIDSGAFSALNSGEVIDLEDYIEWLHLWKHRLFGYMALDVLGNPRATDANLRIMLNAGLNPIPIHVRGEGQERMDELFGLSTWVACGGLRRPKRGSADKSYVRQKMEWAAGRNVHWLGYTEQEMVLKFKPYSVDSASWQATDMWGRAAVYLGRGQFFPVDKSKLASTKLPPAALRMIGRCNVPLADFMNPALWTNTKSIHRISPPSIVTQMSFVQYGLDLRRLVGTRFFLAGFLDQFLNLKWLLDDNGLLHSLI